jgi:hypothetical protein
MRHDFFELVNYRGIGHVRLDLEESPRPPVFTLVGLNESGKTTILEAVNSFSKRIDLNPLDVPGYTARDVHELIPISSRSNFNDDISIHVGFLCEPDDEREIAQYAQKELGLSLKSPIGKFSVEQVWHFKDSKVVSETPDNLWTIELFGRRKIERRPKSLDSSSEEWKKLVMFIRERLPRIVYFPNFLFELPDKIYLEAGSGTEEGKHELYRDVLQDILDAIGEQTTLEQHILARAKSGTPADSRSLESVLLKMGSHITTTVFSSWNRIFKRVTGGKEIQVSIAKEASGRWYLQLRLKDGSNLYEISERSLGFRWFFAFLLLTQYRGFRSKGPRGVLFLFDEPASNLHPSAQSQLLESFGKFPSHAPIVYTTHSHHMVNPDWLEGTFVVKNEAIDYSTGEDRYSAQETLITLTKYRGFAAAHPDQTTYFQPVLDVLNYQPGRLENIPRVVMVEGKNDYYTLRYMQWRLGIKEPTNFLPGTGAGSLTEAIRMYAAWGRQFLILLDADEEGELQKSRYSKLFGTLVDDSLVTLGEVDPAWLHKGTEYLFETTDRLTIQSSCYPQEARFNKTLFNRSIQELLLTEKRPSVSAESEHRFKKLLEYLSNRLMLPSSRTEAAK